ncbi:sensor histidine kinase [Bacillus sp. WMMC1349]|uniref:sensor histidine kinase n=1 Tax=Bacillus sp. WMMC1349 TaxID=2736254 RepID=UPI0015581AF8|nr:histidine kinase [Bacillus sp. WMMC1349]NPC94523.1 sensor histidine kinase [Bacillus sp. WMMC1349]
MELRIMISKLILIGFIIYNCLFSEQVKIPMLVFCLLIYFCINLLIAIIKKRAARQVFIIISMFLSAYSYFEVEPLFILLLPLNLYEWGEDMPRFRRVIFVISMIPIILINGQLAAIYGLTAAFSFLLFSITKLDETRIEKLENQVDQTRKSNDTLTKTINENQEYMRQSQYTFQLEERNRLSQEIHDKIGHSMTGTLIQLEAAKRLLEKDKEKAAELLQNAIHISKEGIEKIRWTLKNIKPSPEQMGINRLKLLIDECSARHNIQISFLYQGDLDVVSHIQWKIIFENITEALTNTIKYAKATHVSINIHVLNTLIKVEVKDNGEGHGKIKKGMGIIGMEERAASVHGKVIVDGSNGFSVTTLLPKYE